MFRPWRSFPAMVTSGLAAGLITGGFPWYAQEISQAALILAMSFSLSEISFSGIGPRQELRSFLMATVLSYGVLGGLLGVFAATSPTPSLRDGWILMAAVPPAVAVVPITSYLRGDVRRALISTALLYLLGLVTVPALTFAFLGRAIPIDALILQTLLLIGVPLAASRPLRRWRAVEAHRPTAVSLSFFVLVAAIAGSTRSTLLERADLLAGLAALSFARTFGLGLLLMAATAALRMRRNERIAATAFSSFKNLGLTVVLAFSFLGPEATLPSIVSLVFEVAWIAGLTQLYRERTRTTPAASVR